MATNRKAIRRAIVAAIKAANTIAGQNVFRSRTKALESRELPSIVVYAMEEKISLFNESPREYERVLQVKIEIALEGRDNFADDVDEDIDDIAEQIEHVFKENQTIDDLVRDVTMTAFDSDLPVEGERKTGGGVLSFDVRYYTLDVSDGLAAPNRLDAFVTGGVTFEVSPSVGGQPQAADSIKPDQ